MLFLYLKKSFLSFLNKHVCQKSFFNLAKNERICGINACSVKFVGLKLVKCEKKDA
ncbi:hypothetical protein YGH029_05790 [Helicobacter pylori]